MRPSEFEEREYEAPLYLQLQHGAVNVWAPGQVLEARVGFDYAMLTSNPFFWKLHGFGNAPSGVVLGTFAPGHWWPAEVNRPIPDFSLNLFIQAKRPYVGLRLSKALKSFGMKRPFWKFDVSHEQQKVLESLSAAVAKSALVCYACPAFDRVTELWAHQRSGTVVQTSTFPTVDSLHGHDAWYYAEPGCIGVANPIPERIEGLGIFERIREYTSGQLEQQGSSFRESLHRLASAIYESLGAEKIGDSGRTSLYFDSLREIDIYARFVRPLEYPDVLRNYLAVSVFVSLFGLQWHVLAPSQV